MESNLDPIDKPIHEIYSNNLKKAAKSLQESSKEALTEKINSLRPSNEKQSITTRSLIYKATHYEEYSLEKLKAKIAKLNLDENSDLNNVKEMFKLAKEVHRKLQTSTWERKEFHNIPFPSYIKKDESVPSKNINNAIEQFNKIHETTKAIATQTIEKFIDSYSTELHDSSKKSEETF